MADQPVVAVLGLRALSRDIQRMTADRGALNKAMAQAGRGAAEPVAAVARSAMASATTPSQQGPHLVDDIRVAAARTGASVRMGRASVRWAGWVEFGGTRRAPHQSRRDYNPRGRFLFPAAVQMAARSADLYSTAIQATFANYPWTNTGTDPGGVHD